MSLYTSVIDGSPVPMATLRDGTYVSEERMKQTYWNLNAIKNNTTLGLDQLYKKIREGKNPFESHEFGFLCVSVIDKDVRTIILNAIELAEEPTKEGQPKAAIVDPRKAAADLNPIGNTAPEITLKTGLNVPESMIINTMEGLNRAVVKSHEIVASLLKNRDNPLAIPEDDRNILMEYNLIFAYPAIAKPIYYVPGKQVIESAIKFVGDRVVIVDPRKK